VDGFTNENILFSFGERTRLGVAIIIVATICVDDCYTDDKKNPVPFGRRNCPVDCYSFTPWQWVVTEH
jgi:hypothetical protein